MTNDEAKKVARIMAAADGGCDFCAARLYQYFDEDFPEHADQLDAVWAANDHETNWRDYD